MAMSEPGCVRRVAIVGGGPAGLMAAQAAHDAGVAVDVFEAKGSVGRKFLVAGKGGLNLTHSEPRGAFDARYGARRVAVADWLDAFDPQAVRHWARGLGIETYVGSSGRVFPLDRKAAPLLRGWVRRLRDAGVQFHVHHRWLGWDAQSRLRFDTPDGERSVECDAVILALGGGSWPQLGSDGAWVDVLRKRGVDIADLQPSNCGFDIGWSEHFARRHAGAPLKPMIAHWHNSQGEHALQGECVVTASGLEGSLIYALSAMLRDTIATEGHADLQLDLAPGRTLLRLQQDLARPRAGRSLSEHLRRQAGIDGAKTGLLYEILGRTCGDDMPALARSIKRLPLALKRPRPLVEAISTAGGVRLEATDSNLMLQPQPGKLPAGVFCAGEMLDWEAPTGGYLLTACFASGLRAGNAAARWLTSQAQADQPAA
ncbi:MAG: family flavoprotein [Xanthomonadaceae bacterium]|nr:family flavoprotein [Xanthomonadaceae bacterium]